MISPCRLILYGLVACAFLTAARTEPTLTQEIYGDAVLRDWVQPAYPPAAAKARQEGDVTVEFVVEPDGHVSEATVQQSTAALFEEAALQAVREWKFEPATEKGQPIRSAMAVPVRFTLEQLRQKRVPISPPEELRPHGLKVTSARATNSVDPDYPDELMARKLPGRVDLAFVIDEQGRAATPHVRWASHAAFVESALRAVEKMKFEPAHQGPVARSTTMEAPMVFGEFGLKRADTLTANRIKVISLPEGSTPPGPFVLIEPVYPIEHLLAGEGGSATAEFRVDERGAVGDVLIKDASAPEYGAVLRAAVEAWGFQPARNSGGSVAARLAISWDFLPPDDGATGRVAARLRPGGEGIAGARGLDRRLAPLWRGFPVYPQALIAEKPAGQAEIDFIIDRDGRVRRPRVKSATREEFGWAAATAVSQWVFERPMRQGQPVDVKVTIPIDFAPPAN
jgi:TonB family protein